MRPIALPCAALLATGLVGAVPAAANEAGVARIDALTRELVPLCLSAPAPRCIEAGFARVDTDGDARLRPAELERLRADGMSWFQARRSQLTIEEQTAAGIALAVVAAVGVERLVAVYDADQDGGLDLEEATADLALDERPLPLLVRDADAVDWEAVRGRLGVVAGALLPPSR